MAQTVADLLEYFSAASPAYTRSDETTLVFPATATGRPFDGRIGKLRRPRISLQKKHGVAHF
ncbi:hypothetical protein B0H14DRAFT_3421547 [Mycena olivaceomarginata]|nr:hypothetical protein B0H14DRAFT_3421547 [Mycena olivaceomarginata]